MNRIGIRIKNKREALGMQVKDLSAAIGVTPSLISQIEKTKSFPSLVTLKKIADALNSTVGELLGENEAHARKPVLRVAGRKFVRQNEKGASLYLLSNHDPQKQMEPYFINFEKGADSKDIMTSNYPSQEFCYVLSGAFEVTASEKKYQLHKGDGFYFNSIQPHLFRNVNDGVSQLIWVVKLN